ncbi:Uncharacterized protein conserved in bacteria [Legionella beliardensis]|uniref:Uncharacterized protein conserved in bacteria n=1 Tax=Legionella beliardensis TaxID=91822 RepID=A0A378I2R7_9GAMM|nr:DUF4440 domain-containing protein [Legionella beliardensis]STX29232.1 Uncharacterized protein conserved in bacteria [Legionella beliardensis]
MQETIINLLIKKEKQLLDKTDSLTELANLIDDDFIEIGSSATCYDKAEVIRWLASDDQSQRSGNSFKAQALAENIILLTYISSIKATPEAKSKQAMRSSIWRLKQGQWRMIFHQGTPLK